MVRAGRRVEIIQVAGSASRAGQVVVAIHMALGALQVCVRSRQRESGRIVIERSSRPGSGRMARIAGRGEARLHVVGVGGRLVVLHVAG